MTVPHVNQNDVDLKICVNHKGSKIFKTFLINLKIGNYNVGSYFTLLTLKSICNGMEYWPIVCKYNYIQE